MRLTPHNGINHGIYASLSDGGIQKFLHSVFVARPHYFNHATVALGGGTPDVGEIAPFPIPEGGAANVDLFAPVRRARNKIFPPRKSGDLPIACECQPIWDSR
jgi:hypothetical protein